MTALAIDKDIRAPKTHIKRCIVDYIRFSHEISVEMNPFLFNVRLAGRYTRRLLSFTF